MARLVSSSASPKIFWKNELRVLSPPTLGSSSVVFSFSELRMVVVIPSQFFLGGFRVPVEASGDAAATTVGAVKALSPIRTVPPAGKGKKLTIGRIANECAPSALSAFHEADFDLDLAHREITGIGVDLTLQWLEYQGLVPMGVGELCGLSVSEMEQKGW